MQKLNDDMLAIAMLLLVAVQLAAISTTVAIIAEVPTVRKCTLERAHRMIGYDCSNLNLKEVPPYMKSDVGILNLSFNRIRELTLSSFEPYDGIKLLYLHENIIIDIEANTFSRLQSLEAIDLSTNGLTTIPKELFDLPLLRNLYVSENKLHHLAYDLSLITKPIRAPLQVLHLSQCRLSNVPIFGPLSDLLQLNVSRNDLTEITPDTFASFCSLQVVDLNNTQTPRCQCHQVTQYLAVRDVRIVGDVQCDTRQHPQADALDVLAYCAETAVVVAESAAFSECVDLLNMRRLTEQTRKTWMWILCGLCGFLVAFMGVLYVLHRRNVNAQRMSKSATVGGGGAVRMPLDVVDGNNDLLLQNTSKV